MPKYIVLEIGKSIRTAFLMKNGEYEETEDAIMLGTVEAVSGDEAINSICNRDYCKERKFDNLITYELV